MAASICISRYMSVIDVFFVGIGLLAFMQVVVKISNKNVFNKMR